MNDKWSLGVLIGLPIIGVIALLCLVGIIGGIIYRNTSNSYDSGDGTFVAGICAGTLAVLLLILGFGYYPYSAEYHKWVYTTGVAQDVNKRLVAQDKGMSEKIVVVIDGQEYGCNDTRCALVTKGDNLAMRCKRSYEWGSVSGYDCRFIKRWK